MGKIVMASVTVQCARCHSSLHNTQACHLPFYRTKTIAEERADRMRRKSEWEARQAEKAEKQAAWEAKQAERKTKQAEWEAKRLNRTSARDKDFDAGSICSSDMVSTAASSAVVVDAQEVERAAMLDKQVRKLAKVLRDIETLEARGD